MVKSVLTTFADHSDPIGYGSSDDDDEDADCSDASSDAEDDQDNDISSRGSPAGRLEQITHEWKRGSKADSTLGEWTRVRDVLQKWYQSQTPVYQNFLGPLTKPFSR